MKKAALTIAIADNHDMLREQTRYFLDFWGYQVVMEARNGHELLDMLGSTEKLPELCMIDINMPVMDGFETARLLRQEYPSIKILAYSLFAQSHMIRKIIDCGADGYLPKESTPATWRKVISGYKSSP